MSLVNLNKVCRVCLSEQQQMYSIYNVIYEENSKEKLPYIYEILVSVSNMKAQVNDGLPSLICPNCISHAQISFKFQKRCNTSQAIFDAFLEQARYSDNSNNELNKFNIQSDCTKFLNANSLNKVKINHQNSVNSSMIDENLTPVLNGLKSEDKLTESNDMPSADGLVDNETFVDCLKSENNETGEPVKTFEELCDTEKLDHNVKKPSSANKIFSCSICKKTYHNCNALRYHIKGNHNDTKSYTCDDCGKSFKSYKYLTCHLRTHSDEQPHSCKICGKKYKQSGTLTAHMRVHTGQKPFLCSVCGKGFRQAPDLGYHMRTHTKEKPYMCNICGKTMRMHSHLVLHMRSHTGEKPFKCKECNKSFPSTTRLKRHEIIHTDEKPYSCEVCKKPFNRWSSLKVHSKIHADDRPHGCSICTRRFLQAHSLRAHMAIHNANTSEDTHL